MSRMEQSTREILAQAVHAVPISVLTHLGATGQARGGTAEGYRWAVLFARINRAPYEGRTIYSFMNDMTPDWGDLTDAHIDTALRKILGTGFNRHLRADWPGRST